MNTNLYKAQCLLLKWMSLKEQMGYDVIKFYCKYLNLQYKLGEEEHPAWKIFLPLFLQGNIDTIGDGKFRVTEPLLIDGERGYVYMNIFTEKYEDQTSIPFICYSKVKPQYEFSIEYKFYAKAILDRIPSIDKVVSSFEILSTNDFTNLVYDCKNKCIGVAKRIDVESSYYFIYPNRKIVSIPNWYADPEAINLAYCYSRVICQEINGYYSVEKHVLRIKKNHFSIILYRILLVESILKGGKPTSNFDYYIFDKISKDVVKKINKILCNSISYE